MATHAFITFNGVNAHLDANFTFTHGIAPSQLQIRIPPNPRVQDGGTLAVVFGGTRLEFPDCKVDRVDCLRNADGLMVWTLTILDRRWKWKECGAISGYYNVREGESADAAAGIPKQVKKGTEKNARALAKLCLEAMGETGFSVTQVPDDIFPETEWDYERPAEALAKLADTIRFRVVLNYRRNRVELWPDGVGQKLTTQGAIDYQLTVDPPERPDSLIFVGSRALWEYDLELEAVARDALGKYHPLNTHAIPYLPPDNIEGSFFWNFDPEFCNAIADTPITGVHGIKTYRDLAKADVYRKYRIKVPFTVGNEQVGELDRILPLLSTRLHIDTRGEHLKPKPPVVWGLFSRGNAAPEYFQELANPRSKLEVVNPPKDMTIEDGFQVDEKTGIVALDKATFQWGKRLGGIRVDGRTVDWPFMKPAKLWLRIGFGVRDKETRGWIHKEITRRSSQRKFGTRPRYIKAEDAIYHTIRGQQRDTANDKDYEKMAKHYLDQAEREYEPRDPCAATYAGILPIATDGAIQQITWSITDSGATTRVSRNREEPVLGLTYDEQRLYQQLRQKLAEPATSRAAEDKRLRRPA